MRLMRLLVVVVSLSTLASAEAGAQEGSTARKKFEEGTTLYDLGQYVEAARAYEAAYRIKNDPALLFNIGQAYRLGGDTASALRAYRSFLRRVPEAPNRAEVERHILALQKQLDEAKPQKPFGPEPEPPPETAPPPTVTTPPPAPAPALSTPALTAAPAPADKPIYKKWWLWTIVGGVVVAGVAVGVGVAATTPSDAARPSGAMAVSFP